VHWTVAGKSATSVVLPAVDRARTAVLLGDPGECAAVAWNGPDEPRPRCIARAGRLTCR
jgi:hypothetical protein